MSKTTYYYIKRKLMDIIKDLKSHDPELADYLENHIIFDNEYEMICYNGDRETFRSFLAGINVVRIKSKLPILRLV